MISLEKLQILKPLQKFPKNVVDLGKLIVAQSPINRPIWSHSSFSKYVFAKLPPYGFLVYKMDFLKNVVGKMFSCCCC